jgi:hypothetical protein
MGREESKGPLEKKKRKEKNSEENEDEEALQQEGTVSSRDLKKKDKKKQKNKDESSTSKRYRKKAFLLGPHLCRYIERTNIEKISWPSSTSLWEFSRRVNRRNPVVPKIQQVPDNKHAEDSHRTCL